MAKNNIVETLDAAMSVRMTSAQKNQLESEAKLIQSKLRPVIKFKTSNYTHAIIDYVFSDPEHIVKIIDHLGFKTSEFDDLKN